MSLRLLVKMSRIQTPSLAHHRAGIADQRVRILYRSQLRHGFEAPPQTEAKLRELSVFVDSPLFTDRERAALAYAEAITHFDRMVDGTLLKRLKKHFDEEAIIELTALIAFRPNATPPWVCRRKGSASCRRLE